MKISVALCTYNGVRYVREQLASIASQTRRPDELLVCDDDSQDETVWVVEEFAATAPFAVRIHVNEHNLGTTQNFARAISLSEGEIIVLCDQDDVWLPEKLAVIEAEFAANPRVGLVFTDAEVVDEELRPLGVTMWAKLGFDQEMQRLVASGRALDVLLPGWTVTGATMAFRAAFKPLILDIPRDLQMIHDGWIALVVAAVAGVSLINKPLIKYRQHGRQQIGAPNRDAPDAGPQIRGLDDVRATLAKKNRYQELIEIGERVRQRLSEREDQFDSSGALSRLAARLKHLRARSQMPESRFRRLTHILPELLSCRYHLYSRGVLSALKDLFG